MATTPSKSTTPASAVQAQTDSTAKVDPEGLETKPNYTDKAQTPVVREEAAFQPGAHIKGRRGFELLDDSEPVDIVKAAKDAAPSLTDAVIDGFELTDEELENIAIGAVPAPPVHGPIHSVDQYLQPGGFTSVPVGVDPAKSNPSAGSR